MFRFGCCIYSNKLFSVETSKVGEISELKYEVVLTFNKTAKNCLVCPDS
jgi:hypothetical protein